MPGKNQNEDEIFNDGEDDLSATLRDAYDKAASKEESDEEGGFERPLGDDDIEKRDVVEEEEGVRRIEAARDSASRKAKSDESEIKKGADEKEGQEDKAQAASQEDKARQAEAPKEADDKGVTAASDDEFSKAVEALSPAVRKRIEEQQSAYAEIMAPLKGKDAELERLGVTPRGAMEFFVNINDYANRDPGGYIAWVLGHTASDPDKMEAVLKKAAEAHGYTIAKGKAEADDDDPFASDSEKALAKEVRELKAQLAGQSRQAPHFGPDSPAEQQRRTVMSVIAEEDGAGNPLRPHFDTLQPMITNLIKQKVAESGRPMTREDLIEAYETAELAHPKTREAAKARLLGGASTSAAQGDAAVREQVKTTAAASAKAKAASTKIIDGPGQSAGRQPADADADLPLDQFIAKQLEAHGFK